MVKYDYIIVGAGAAGLMMAYRMAKESFFADKTILILDKEKKTQNDRTWCFWEQNKGEWDDILHHSWNKIYFASDSYSSKKSISRRKIRNSNNFEKHIFF